MATANGSQRTTPTSVGGHVVFSDRQQTVVNLNTVDGVGGGGMNTTVNNFSSISNTANSNSTVSTRSSYSTARL